MRGALLRLMAGVTAAAALGDTSAHASDFPPIRRSGLWEMTMIRAGGMTGKAQACVSSAQDKANGFMPPPPGANCDPPRVDHAKGGMTVHLVCHSKAGSSTDTTVVMTGDFQRSYTMKVSTQTTPAASNARPAPMSFVARYLGPCPSGMQPGDARAAR